jgi:quinol monooxygenase YgiN
MSSKKLTIVANIHAKADKIDLVKAELLKLIEPTLAEAGCINYDCHQDNENPTHFMFYENWESRELWQVHMNNQNLADFIAATDGALESLTVNEMTHIA